MNSVSSRTECAALPVYVDRLLALQLDEGLPIYVVPVYPFERITLP